MSVSNKIKALLQISGKKNKDLAEFLGLSVPQSLNNKFKRESFTAQDLINIATFAGFELAFISDTQIITLDLSDINPTSPVTEEA